jgi:CO dehydrogenase/acetyl-CoA synthase alpha subunit
MKGAEYSHPCYGCIHLQWDFTGLDHGSSIYVPYCDIDFYLTTNKCEGFENG